jgi:hypothetical protein
LLLGCLLGSLAACERQTSSTPVQVLQPDAACNPVKKVCEARGGPVALGLRLDASAQALKPFRVTVSVHGMVPDSVTADFNMPGMDMGRNRYQLERGGGDNWIANVILPVCASGRNDWEAVVSAVRGDAGARAIFPFHIGG